MRRSIVLSLRWASVLPLSLHRDVMGQSFRPRDLHFAYLESANMLGYERAFETRVLFGRDRNEFVFDGAWLDGTPMLANEIAYSTLRDLGKSQLAEFEEVMGVGGRVIKVLLQNLPGMPSLEQAAEILNMSPRTLRRRLEEEDTSYRQLCDDLRMKMAVRYLRDTQLTVEQIADALGFSDAANFRHAFHRWTSTSPNRFRDLRRVSGMPVDGEYQSSLQRQA